MENASTTVIKNYGSAKMVESWGDDYSIAKIARVSTGSENKGKAANRRLIKTLLEHDHGSPLEFGGMIFRLNMPLYLVAQLQRHRMASYSQRSGRYVEMDLTFHKPSGWRRQSLVNRQMSDTLVSDQQAAENAYLGAIEASVTAYQKLLALGVSREQARTVLPVCTETELYAQFNLRSLMNFLRLRKAHDAQGEMQLYAQEMEDHFVRQFPLIGELHQVLCEVESDLASQRKQLWQRKVDDLAEFEIKRLEHWTDQARASEGIDPEEY